jgi:hypothetical protein
MLVFAADCAEQGQMPAAWSLQPVKQCWVLLLQQQSLPLQGTASALCWGTARSLLDCCNGCLNLQAIDSAHLRELLL